MSLFSQWLHSLAGSNDLYAQANRNQSLTTTLLQNALLAQQQAQQRADLAATPALDQTATLIAGEAQLRKMLQAAGVRFASPPLGAAPLGYATATGG